MSVVTRFAPSPTGFLHIGGARTALFNWLYARHHGGVYRLRIEDTDRERSTQAAIDAIIDGLNWLGLEPDGEIVFQSRRAGRHAEVVETLLRSGCAYRCFASQEELKEMRERARAEGRPMRYDGRWRDRDPAEAPPGVDPVIRLKMPRDGETAIHDLVQGEVTIANEQLDDMVLLRSDGSPTYMLSVVVDDNDMGVTHVIRGDDHLTNAFRQYQLFIACGWTPPAFAHIPLIHGPDGAKLSKRHGALGVEAYREMGYLPEALCNYLLRLGWAHGDEEIISRDKAIEWFDLPAVGRSPARFDFAKLDHINAHYLKEADDRRLAGLVAESLVAEGVDSARTEPALTRLRQGMAGLKQRAKTTKELIENARFYADRPVMPPANPKAAKLLGPEATPLLQAASEALANIGEWDEPTLEARLREVADARGEGLGKIAQPLRAALTGSTVSPGIFEIMVVLGRDETLARISAARL